MAEKIFVNGMSFKEPRQGAPDFVKGSISIKIEDLIPFLEQNANEKGWVNIDVKESKGGKLYCELNTYQRGAPKADTELERLGEEINSDDIPY